MTRLLGVDASARQRITEGSGSDPDIARVVLLLDFEDTVGSGTPIDRSPLGWVCTAQSPSVISNAQARSGSRSLSCNGSAAGVYITQGSGSPNPLEFGTRDFTLEASVYGTNSWASSLNSVWGAIESGGSNRPPIRNTIDSSGNLQTAIWDSGGTLIVNATSEANLSTGQWYDLCACRVGANVRIFVNGSVVATHNIGSGTALKAVGNRQWGFGGIAGEMPLNGYIDCVRWTMGLGRYTGAYTPTFPFPSS